MQEANVRVLTRAAEPHAAGRQNYANARACFRRSADRGTLFRRCDDGIRGLVRTKTGSRRLRIWRLRRSDATTNVRSADIAEEHTLVRLR
jgi:hypothetical protein